MLALANLLPWRNKVSDADVEQTGSALARFHSEIDDMFQRFFDDPLWGGSRLIPESRVWAGSWSPSLDVSEGADEFVIRAEVPGVDPSDFEVSVTGDVLSISGEKKEESEERRGNVYRSERRFGSFRRNVRLPEGVNADKVEAEYDKGVVTIRLAKGEKAVGRRIPVSLKK
ncbi:MAG: Hsp20/alpha crystallin family protein [Gemmatimonadales bacterium]|jgi:HSP20 family protein